MLLVRTASGEVRLINPSAIKDIRPQRAGTGSEITMRDSEVLVTEVPFQTFAQDLFTKKFGVR